MTSAESRQRPYKVWSCDRQTRKAVMASNLRELRERGSSRLGFPASDVKIVLESDGTEVEDDIYFQTIDRDTIFLILCPGERWLPPGVEALRAVPRNLFNNTPWPQQAMCVKYPFQGVPQTDTASVSHISAYSLPKMSFPNGTVNSCWPLASNQAWAANQFQNGQPYAFQNKTTVIDSCNPWSESFGINCANPFTNGSFRSGLPANLKRSNAGKNPFL